MSNRAKKVPAPALPESSSVSAKLPMGATLPPLPKLTKNERFVYDHLCAVGCPLKAYEVLGYVKTAHGIKAPMTVYRALDSLQAKGLVKKITKTSTYFSVNRTAAACSVIVCATCGKTTIRDLNREQVIGLFGSVEISPEQIFIEAHLSCLEDSCTS